jgi:predicted transcriptional regulator
MSHKEIADLISISNYLSAVSNGFLGRPDQVSDLLKQKKRIDELICDEVIKLDLNKTEEKVEKPIKSALKK